MRDNAIFEGNSIHGNSGFNEWAKSEEAHQAYKEGDGSHRGHD